MKLNDQLILFFIVVLVLNVIIIGFLALELKKDCINTIENDFKGQILVVGHDGVYFNDVLAKKHLKLFNLEKEGQIDLR